MLLQASRANRPVPWFARGRSDATLYRPTALRVHALAASCSSGAGVGRQESTQETVGSGRLLEQPSILVVDDDPDIRDILALILESRGFEVRSADNGLRALETLGQWRPRLIILDLMMPEMDGRSFRERQLASPELSAIPVVVMSAAHRLTEAARDLQPGGLIAKPFDLTELLRVVDGLIGDDPA
jgi:CheY-like chemotaxis protein